MTDDAFLIWSSSGRSHPGKVRTANEDAYLDLPDLGLWAVADGMGGHEAGDVASRTITEELGKIHPASSLDDFADQVKARVQLSNRKLYEQAIERQQTIGSTLVVLTAFGRDCTCLWAGDSRAYLFRTGSLERVTRDHSVIEDQIAEGLVSREQAEHGPDANAITRAVGAEPDLELDELTFRPKDGDVLLLCSDGLYKAVAEHEIAASLEHDATTAVSTLMEAALEAGARDNVSIVAVRFSDPFQQGDT